jgi:hypothetical protein
MEVTTPGIAEVIKGRFDGIVSPEKVDVDDCFEAIRG